MHLHLELGKRHIAVFLGSVAALIALALSPQLLGDLVADGVAGLADASPGWLWLAAAAFGASLITSACGWESALTRCGGTTSRTDASARYCTGSIVNALAPARIGTAVRFALMSRVLHNEGRLWTVGGIAGSLSAVRAVWLAIVLALASASGVLPRWPIAALLLAAAAAAALAWRARDSRPGTTFGHALDVFRVLGRCPRAAAQIAGWVGLAMALRVLAATAIAAAFGVEQPLAAAVLIIPALDLAGNPAADAGERRCRERRRRVRADRARRRLGRGRLGRDRARRGRDADDARAGLGEHPLLPRPASGRSAVAHGLRRACRLLHGRRRVRRDRPLPDRLAAPARPERPRGVRLVSDTVAPTGVRL